MILSTGATLRVTTPPSMSSYVHFPVEIHLQLFTTVIITTCILYGGTAPIVTRVRGQLPPLPPPMVYVNLPPVRSGGGTGCYPVGGGGSYCIAGNFQGIYIQEFHGTDQMCEV